jgi:hypothetical protein
MKWNRRMLLRPLQAQGHCTHFKLSGQEQKLLPRCSRQLWRPSSEQTLKMRSAMWVTCTSTASFTGRSSRPFRAGSITVVAAPFVVFALANGQHSLSLAVQTLVENVKFEHINSFYERKSKKNASV